MRWIVIVLGLAGCTEHGKSPDGGTPTADSPGAPICESQFEGSLDRMCNAPDECVLIDHDDCCGTIKVGVRVGTEAAAHAAEKEWGLCRQCPPVGCAHADRSEDGMTAGAGQSIVARCVMSVCTSRVEP